MVSRRDFLKGIGALALAPLAGKAVKTATTATKVNKLSLPVTKNNLKIDMLLKIEMVLNLL